jgi:hypothetical protein
MRGHDRPQSTMLDCTAADGAIITVEYVDVEDGGHCRARIGRGRGTLHSATLAPLSWDGPKTEQAWKLIDDAFDSKGSNEHGEHLRTRTPTKRERAGAGRTSARSRPSERG